MKFILYGPPGIGKSTMIRALQDAGYKAFDLEDLPNTELREVFLEYADNCILGGADTKPKMSPDRVNILLGLDEDEYAKRRALRDSEHPEKAEQQTQTVEQWVKAMAEAKPIWNAYLPADYRWADRIREILDRPHIHIRPKPHKTADNWTPVVQDHHDGVHALMSWLAFRIETAGRNHDIDKLYKDNPNHGDNDHHWYRADHHDEFITLLAPLESVCDTVATTWGRYLNDPWELGLWTPPEQTAEWWTDTYARTV